MTAVADEAEAVAAVPVEADDEFILDGRLLADDEPSVRRLGPRAFGVRWRFAPSEQGSVTKKPDDPLDELPQYDFQEGVLSEPTDVDALGRPILNAAGFPLQGATSETPFGTLTITKNQSRYEIAAFFEYFNKFNTDTIYIPHLGEVGPGQLLVRNIKPTHKWDANTRRFNVAYTLWIGPGRRPMRDDDGMWDTWKYRFLNAGRMGWYETEDGLKAGEFVNNEPGDRPEPTLLKADGTPIDPKVGVWAGGSAALPAPPAVPIADSLVEPYGVEAVFLKYYKAQGRPLAGLTIFS